MTRRCKDTGPIAGDVFASDGSEMTYYEFQRGEPNSVDQRCFALMRDPGFGDDDEPFHWQDTDCQRTLHFIAKFSACLLQCHLCLVFFTFGFFSICQSSSVD